MAGNKKRPFFDIVFGRFTKIIVIITIIYSMILTTISYIWSYIGRDPLVDLSSTLISTLVAPVITYLVTNAVQSIFEYNKLIFSTPLSALNSTQKQTEEVDDINIINLDEEKEITDYGTDT